MTDRDLFIAALEHSDPAGRGAFLDAACAGDADRRRRLDVLLRAHDEASRFLAVPVVGNPDPGDPTRPAPPTDPTPVSGIDIRSLLTPTDRPGLLGLLDHYEVREVVGSGGMGVVLKAFDPKLHRLVAVKVMAPHLAAHGAARKRFEREARAVAAVRNEHVVAIHGVESGGPTPYLVMEFVGGVSLQDRLERRGPLEVKEILRIGMQAARGLAAAHAQGVIHRDVKPANILLENGVERVKLTDFGLARMADDANLTQSGTITGTPNYMSPEQAAGTPVDARSDLFSLGSVLYALCTGHPPFRADSPLAVVRRVCDDPVRPVREINPDIPDWLDAIVRKLLTKNPADRFQTAADVADLLGQYLAHVQQPQVVPLPAGVSPAPAMPPARPPKLGCMIALAVFVGLAMVIGFRDTLWEVFLKSGLIVLVYMLATSPVFLVVYWVGRSRATGSAERFLWDLGILFVLMGTGVGLLEWWGSSDVGKAVNSHLIGLVLASVVVNLPHLPRLIESARGVARSWGTRGPGPIEGPAMDGQTALALGIGYFTVVVGLLASAFARDLAPTSEQRVLWLLWLMGVWMSVGLLAFGPGVFVARRWWRKRRPEDRRADSRAAIGAGLGIGLTVMAAVLFVVRTPGLREGMFGGPKAELSVRWSPYAVDRVIVERPGLMLHEYDAERFSVLLPLPAGAYTVTALKAGTEVYREEVRLESRGKHEVSIFESSGSHRDHGFLEITCTDPTLNVTLQGETQTITFSRPGQETGSSVKIGHPVRPNEQYVLGVYDNQEVVHVERVRMKAGEQREIYIPRFVRPERRVELKTKALSYPTDVVRMAIARDRSAVAVGRLDGPILVFDAETGQERFTIARPRSDCTAFGFTPDSQRLAYLTRTDGRDEVLRLVNAGDGQPAGEDLKPPAGRTFSNAHALAFSPDGKRLAISSAYNAGADSRLVTRVDRWELGTGAAGPRELEPLTGQDGEIRSLTFTPNGADVLAAGGTGNWSAWVWETGQPKYQNNRDALFAYDRVAAGGPVEAVSGWSEVANKPTVVFSQNWPQGKVFMGGVAPGPIRFGSLAVSADGKRVAAGVQGAPNGRWEDLPAIRVWDPATMQQKAALLGHTDWPMDLVFEPSGTGLVSAGKDGTVRYWRVP